MIQETLTPEDIAAVKQAASGVRGLVSFLHTRGVPTHALLSGLALELGRQVELGAQESGEDARELAVSVCKLVIKSALHP
jgi:hypothetical protein